MCEWRLKLATETDLRIGKFMLAKCQMASVCENGQIYHSIHKCNERSIETEMKTWETLM